MAISNFKAKIYTRSNNVYKESLLHIYQYLTTS